MNAGCGPSATGRAAAAEQARPRGSGRRGLSTCPETVRATRSGPHGLPGQIEHLLGHGREHEPAPLVPARELEIVGVPVQGDVSDTKRLEPMICRL